MIILCLFNYLLGVIFGAEPRFLCRGQYSKANKEPTPPPLPFTPTPKKKKKNKKNQQWLTPIFSFYKESTKISNIITILFFQ